MKYIKLAALVLCGALGLCAMGCSAGQNETSATTESTTEATKAPVTNEGDEFVGDYPAFEVTTTSLKANSNMWEDRMGTANISPALSWEPVEGASCYVIYMVDCSHAEGIPPTNFIHWIVANYEDTEIIAGEDPANFYALGPEAGTTHSYAVYVIALKAPVERAKGATGTMPTNFNNFLLALDTDADGNTGNILAFGYLKGKYTAD